MSDAPLFHPLPPIDAATWRQQVERELGADVASLGTTVAGGLSVAPIYPTRPGAEAERAGPLGGRTATGGGSWRVAQRYAQPQAAAARAALERDCALGLETAWLRLDLGGSRDDGITVADHGALIALLADEVTAPSLIIDAGSDGLAMAAYVVAALKQRDAKPASVALALDPLAALAGDGILRGSLADAWRQMNVVTSWCDETESQYSKTQWSKTQCSKTQYSKTQCSETQWYTACVSTVPYHDGGADPVQELAYAIATAVEYLRALTADGRTVASAASRLYFTCAVGRDLFLETAKLRALRWLWRKVVTVAGSDAAAHETRIVACTSTTTKSRRGAMVNQLRVTTEAFAAALGGADDLVAAPFDAVTRGLDTRGGRLAINTQHVLAEEAHLGRVADPAAGSGYVEALTEQLARAAWEQFQALEAAGGMAACLQSGAVADAVAARASERRQAVATRLDPFIGASAFVLLDEPATESPSSSASTATPVGAGWRPAGRPEDSTLADRDFASLIQEASKHDAEAFALAVSTGPPDRARRCEPLRWTAPFELLHAAADRVVARTGTRPSCLLLRLGAARDHQPQAAFARRALAVGGLGALDVPGAFDAADAHSRSSIRAALEALAEMLPTGTARPPTVVCPGGVERPEALVEVLSALREAGIPRLVIAGPASDADGAADDVLREGDNLLATLARLHASLGITP